MTGTNCDLFTHKQSRSYLNHLVCRTHIKILGAKRMTRSKFHTENPQTFGARVQNCVTHDLCSPDTTRNNRCENLNSNIIKIYEMNKDDRGRHVK